MKKTYWWRNAVLLLTVVGIAVGYSIFYPYKTGLCSSSAEGCFFSSLKKSFAEPLFLFSFFSLIASLFLFFITDKIFLKWLRFAAVWIVLSIILIAITPQYPSGGIMSGPDREIVSIWLGGLFVVLSFGKIVWDVVKEKSNK